MSGADSGVDKSRFQIDVNDEVTLSRDDTVEHAKHGPMHVDQVSISALGKRARLQSELREDRMSIELTEEELQEAWGDTIADDPFELEGETVRYAKSFASKDDEIEIDIEVSGPKDEAEPVNGAPPRSDGSGASGVGESPVAERV